MVCQVLIGQSAVMSQSDSQLQLFCLHAMPTEQHVVQNQVIDVQAMLVALVACLVPPLPRLNKHKPAFHLGTLRAIAFIAVNALGLLVLDISYMVLLRSKPWFHGGNGTAYMVSQTCLCVTTAARSAVKAQIDRPNCASVAGSCLMLLLVSALGSLFPAP